MLISSSSNVNIMKISPIGVINFVGNATNATVIDSGWSIINNVVLSIARYLQNGQIVDVEENGGLLEATRPMDFLPGFSLEGNLYKINIL